MTIIAWDGRTLAADKRTSFGTEFTTTTKIKRINGSLVGCAGDTALCAAMFAWAEAGYAIDAFPHEQKDRVICVSMLVINPDGRVLHYGPQPHPFTIEDKTYTIGSGSQFAAAAMHLGLDAHRAVEVACELDINCGNGIDTLILEQQSQENIASPQQ